MEFEYSVIYSGRRSVGITISPKAGVVVHAPLGISKSKLYEILREKSGWIEKKLKFFQQTSSSILNRKYTKGELFLFLGVEYPLNIVAAGEEKSYAAFFDGACINAIVPEGIPGKDEGEYVKGQLRRWYIACATDLLKEKVQRYADIMNVHPSRVKLKEQKSRWGSCSSKGNINLNWKIIMAPMHIVDYIVIHELAHLVHMDHAKGFWSLVETYVPDYKARRKWLKINGIRLNLD